MILPILLVLIFILPGPGSAAEVQVSPVEVPRGAVVLVVDGMGSGYVYPGEAAHTLEGMPLDHPCLYNLTGSRALYVKAPVTRTGAGHSVLVTGYSGADEDLVGVRRTIFDVARDGGYLCLAILQRGDFRNMRLEQDALLYFEENSIRKGEPVLGSGEKAPSDVVALMDRWRLAFPSYVRAEGVAGYLGYDRFALEAATDLVYRLNVPFLLFVNAGAADSAGHYLGPDGYLEVVEGLDGSLGRLGEACRKNGVLLVVTADHGMAFSGSRGGHASEKYSGRSESYLIPAVFSGPGVEELVLGGVWSQADVAPTVLSLMGLSPNLTMADGRAMPLKERYDLGVALAGIGDVVLLRDGEVLAKGEADDDYRFRGLERGLYTLRHPGGEEDVVVMGDGLLDLRAAPKPPEGTNWRMVVGGLLILIINLAGALAIFRIWREK